MELSGQELAAVLAALRYYQQAFPTKKAKLPQGIAEIATDCGQFKPLLGRAIDKLCEKLNTVKPEVRARIVVAVNVLDQQFDVYCDKPADTVIVPLHTLMPDRLVASYQAHDWVAIGLRDDLSCNLHAAAIADLVPKDFLHGLPVLSTYDKK